MFDQVFMFDQVRTVDLWPEDIVGSFFFPVLISPAYVSSRLNRGRSNNLEVKDQEMLMLMLMSRMSCFTKVMHVKGGGGAAELVQKKNCSNYEYQ